MNFSTRLKFYGIGFGIGLLMVYAMFGTRSCTTPGEVKIGQLMSQTMELSALADCKLKCADKNKDLLRLELRHFEINYDLSKVHNEPCGQYFIQPKEEFAKEYNYTLIMNDCDTITRIYDINIPSKAGCTCP
jgi:hypothetical protein